MTLYAGISARHVNSYHQNNSLLFQFILAEFLEAFTEIQRLDSLCSRTSNLSSDELSCRQAENNLHLIHPVLTKLVGSTRDYMRLFSWNFSEGLLPKLRTYCALFLQNADTDEKELIAIQHYADKIWQNCLQALDALHEVPQDRTQLFASLEKSSSAMQRFAKLMTRLIHQFRNDENVIFYVLRNHKTFDKLYGNRFVIKLFSKIYPKGLKEAHNLLITKFTDRGFENMLPSIFAATAEVEASSL
ncbi:MAG TPA: hypothetical protein VGP47_00875 [Parachlamydiaceae bacterium]|nr:hypothetical protein [Parachlamydiaceae bacterium]